MSSLMERGVVVATMALLSSLLPHALAAGAARADDTKPATVKTPPSKAPAEKAPAAKAPPVEVSVEIPIPGVYEPDVPGAPAPAPTQTPRRRVDPKVATRVLREGLRQHRASVGHDLPAASTVAQAFADQARVHTPPVSRAVYQIRIASDGQLVSVEIASFEGGRLEQWREVADAAERDLAVKRLRLPPGSYPSGALVKVHVDQSLEMPSGAGRSHVVRPAEKSFALPRWPFAPDLENPRLARRLEPDWPSAFIPPTFETCIPTRTKTCPPPGLRPGVSAGGVSLSGAFDVSDLGSHPVRVVHTHVETTPLEPPEAGPRRPAPATPTPLW